MKPVKTLLGALVLAASIAALVRMPWRPVEDPLPESPAAPEPSAPPPGMAGAADPHPASEPFPPRQTVSILEIRCDRNLAAPGDFIEFDVLGRGLDAALRKKLHVKTASGDASGALLRVTANQLHGEIRISQAAPTGFTRLGVHLNGELLAESDPVGVVRPGEILEATFAEVGADGRSGRIALAANLSKQDLGAFRIGSDAVLIRMAPPEASGPLTFEIGFDISPELPYGTYPLRAAAPKSSLERSAFFRIVRPTLGKTGIIHAVSASSRAVRAGESIEITLTGAGLSPESASSACLRVAGEPGECRPLSRRSLSRLEGVLAAPMKLGSFGIAVVSEGRVVFERKEAFRVVRPGWVEEARLESPARPGATAELRIEGVGLGEEAAGDLRVESDEPGLEFGPVRPEGSSGLIIPMRVRDSVQPGDYLLRFRGRTGELSGNLQTLIRIEAGGTNVK